MRGGLIYEKERCGAKRILNTGEQGKTIDQRNMHAVILGVVGIILVIVGIAIATVRGTGLRGSGLGTIAVVAGVVLLVIAALRFFYKSPPMTPPPP